ncbi:drug/metabolite transporter (DMT)-like permease [Microbacterium phyllosphaerae]|uniref:Drug/metabolite transporter (DMT)-like permease n=1 Tax=Microbacterium phyllosphaerae TaxID=124798 RepID=A0ABS4WMT1_9MICO|nr:DMT family transporter [Microbacterium phyllosphaerae]MBP2377517.1 drug/metabolite transporter (DMT)-like permease [Microbacterium phyllosphaerae]
MTPSRVAAVSVASGMGGVRLVGESLALVVLLAATWVIAGIAVQGAGVGVVSAGRAGFAALGLLLLVLLSSRGGGRSDPPASVRRLPRWQLAVLSVTGVAGYTLLSTVAIALAGPAVPSLILALSPVVVLVLESALTKARVRPVVLVATVVAIVGAVLYVVPRPVGAPGSSTAWGVLAAVGAMLSMAAYGLLFAHGNRGRRGPMAPRILPIFALGSAPLMLWAVVEVSAGEGVELVTIGVLALLGLGIYVPAYLVQHRIILSAGPSFAALLGLAVPPLVGVASAAVGLSALPGPLQVVGITLTLAGMLAVIRMKLQVAPAES